MKKSAYFLCLIVMLSACKEEKLTKVTVEKETLREGRYQLTTDQCTPLEEGMSYNDCLCEDLAAYPQLRGQGDAQTLRNVNAILKEPFAESHCPEGKKVAKPPGKTDEIIQQYSNEYEISFQSPTLLSVVYSTYSYTGGAHGNSALESRTINLTNGKRYETNDLIADPSAANAEILKQLRAKEAGTVFEEVLQKPADFIANGTCNDCVLALTKDGISVQFQTYAVGPYSSGIIGATLPASFIKNPEIRTALMKK